ncbi:MAG: hypothetical protein ACXVA9_01705 [Bdellovibrionales bacterium]
MSLSPKSTWFKFILTVAVAAAPVVEMPANAVACADKMVDACQSAGNDIKTRQAMNMRTEGNKQAVGQTGNALNQAAFEQNIAGDKCGDLAKECDKECKTESDKKACKKQVAGEASDLKTQAAANESSGGGMGAVAGLMGAALGAAMGMMLAKKKDTPPPPPPPVVATGALQLNGSLNCQMQDSFHYEDCNSFLTQYCASAATSAASAVGTVASNPVTGTIISSPGGGLPMTPDCMSFNSSYCSTQVTPVQPYGMTRTDGAVTQVNMAGSGEGLGTPYCASTVASAWCADPVYASARMACPACQQMQTTTSAYCAQNPAECMAQNSPQQLTQIQNQAACQGDPLFTPGSPYAVGGTAATGIATTGAINNGLPVVVLPASTGGGGLGANTVTGGAAPNPSTGIAVSSASGSKITGGAAREGTGVTAASGAAGGSSGGGMGSLAFKTSSVHAGPSELIAAGGVIVAGGPASVSRGPASDVESQYGPSLFTTSSQVIRQHCQAGKLNNCP